MVDDANVPLGDSSDEETLAGVGAWSVGNTRDRRNTMTLRYATYLPGSATSRCAKWLVFLNGRTEWIEKYAYVPRDLQLGERTGFLTWDHRGQGASGGARSYVESYKDFSDDAAVIAQRVLGTAPPPYVIAAHSMGGLIALHAVLTGALKPKALILCSPLLELPRTPIPKGVGRLVASLVSRAGVGHMPAGFGDLDFRDFDGNPLTSDRKRFDAMANSPYRIGSVTFGWVRATFRALDEVFSAELLAKLNIPVLMLSGTQETVVDASGFQAWIAAAKSHGKAHVRHEVIEGAKHELLSEAPVYYKRACTLIRDWVLEHVGE